MDRVRFINAFTGVEMWVATNRVEEYQGAGHILAPLDVEEPKADETPKKTRTKKVK